MAYVSRKMALRAGLRDFGLWRAQGKEATRQVRFADKRKGSMRRRARRWRGTIRWPAAAPPRAERVPGVPEIMLG